jgi:methylenetetrahydrofolate dehydrogenase (NADP+)/methenyltetrahydrofolate cyclohydrolase
VGITFLKKFLKFSYKRCLLFLNNFQFNMTAKIIDGVALSAHIRTELKSKIAALHSQNTARGQNGTSQLNVPGLVVILVGENPASQVYVRNKIKACGECGIYSELKQYPADLSEAALLQVIADCNANPALHGILVQMPLPAHINSHKVLEAISPEKDVDGFHVASAGALMTGQAGFKPCTPYGVMKMLEQIAVPLKGAHAVVIGRSNIVGKPQAMLLLQQDCTVTICHSATRDLAAHTRQADIIVAAVGRENMLTADMVKPSAVVIDVGMNRNAQGKLCGDVDFAGVAQVASWITPVPGGVGPMTITMLMQNTFEAFEKSQGL